MPSDFIRDTNHIPQLLSQLKDARGRVLVGFPARGAEETEIATIARANEYGVITIPARPFLRPAFDGPEMPQQVSRSLNRLLVRGANVKQLLDGMGLQAVAVVRARIRSNTPPPNAESTVKRKGSRRTLIDTGRMLQSVMGIWEGRT